MEQTCLIRRGKKGLFYGKVALAASYVAFFYRSAWQTCSVHAPHHATTCFALDSAKAVDRMQTRCIGHRRPTLVLSNFILFPSFEAIY